MRYRMRAGSVLLAACVVTLVGCGGSTEPSDSGYTGTWVRGGGRVTSSVAIARSADGYRVLVSLETDDGSRRLTCDWDGDCIEQRSGVPFRKLTFKPWLDPESGRLRVAYEVRIPGTGEIESRYVDEYVVQPGGLELKVVTVERNGEMLPDGARQVRRYRKISDSTGSIQAPPSGKTQETGKHA